MMTSKLVKRMLLAVILIGIGGVVATFVTYRKTFNDPAKIVDMLPENTTVSMGAVEHTATREGRTQWHLKAASASLMDGKQKLVLQTPAVVFFREDGLKIHLTAETGILQKKTNNITMTGNVVARTGPYRFEGDSAVYDHSRRFISSQSPVKIFSDRAELAADAMTFDLGTNRAIFTGRVKGVFSEQIS